LTILKNYFMEISQKFDLLCDNLRMSKETVDTVSYRYHRIIHQLNESYYGIDNDSLHGLYVGSYGRGTAINTSDIDMLFVLPYEEYVRFNRYLTNGQSALLQDVKNSIQKTYPSSYISGDGQVIVVYFTDGVTFEVVPCFGNNDNSFTFPDSNNGGSWKITNPRPEISAINSLNNCTNKNLKRLCRMVRAWKEQNNVLLGGLLIDTLAYRFLKDWEYRDKTTVYYDWMTRDFFDYLSSIDDSQSYWCAVGSNQLIYRKGPFAAKAKKAYDAAVAAIAYKTSGYDYSANLKWQEIYGTRFPH